MQSLTRQLALEHAYAEAPKEACGLVVVHESIEIFYKCSNISETPEETFVLNPDHYAAAEDLGEITAVFHSHPKTPPTPSPLDKMGIEETQLPWVIVSLIDAEKPNWHTATPTN